MPCLVVLNTRYYSVQILRKRYQSQSAGKWRKEEIQKKLMLGYLGTSNELGDKNVEFPFVSFDNIVAATENFSDCHMLGRGGFGKVYKVMTHLRVIVT